MTENSNSSTRSTSTGVVRNIDAILTTGLKARRSSMTRYLALDSLARKGVPGDNESFNT